MVLLMPKSKRAQVTALLIVLAVMGILAGGAYILSGKIGSEITGFATTQIVSTCNTTIIGNDVSITLSSDFACPPGEPDYYGIIATGQRIQINCLGNEISGPDAVYPAINVTGDKVEIRNCKITGFGTGINIGSAGSYYVNITNNVINSNGADINFENDLSNALVWNNNFYGGGVVNGQNVEKFCKPVSYLGNFYKKEININERGSDDCGNITIYNSTGGQFKLDVYNISELVFNWSEQSSSSYEPVSYYIWISDSATGFISVAIVDDLFLSGTVDYLDTIFQIRVIPSTGAFNETAIESLPFRIFADADGDGAGVTDPFRLNDTFDCDDSNIHIKQPSNRENDTSYNTTFCNNIIDDDCDGSFDWLDAGCGKGFSPGSFDPSLYLNGSMENLSISQLNTTDFYVLINNTHGKVEYFDKTDLTGVVFDDIFAISHNNISADPGAPNGDRFDKEANLTLLGIDEFEKVPELLKDGVPCTPGECYNIRKKSEFTNNLTFTVSGFSSYSATENSRLATFTQNDSEAEELSTEFPKALETYHRLRFYANYTRYPDNLSLNNRTPTDGNPDVFHDAKCNITLFDTAGSPIAGVDEVNMTYDEFYGVYHFESGNQNFTSPSEFYSYQIGCNSEIYEPLLVSEQFTVIEDVTPPSKPTLYPQLLLYPSNWSTETWTWVAGYFGESDIPYTINVLHGTFSYQFNGTTNYTDEHSEFKGENPIVNFDSTKGQNVTFISWTDEIEVALQNFEFIEFSNHNRTFFRRYFVVESDKTGDDVRIETNETFEVDIPIGTTIQIFNNPVPSGYFKRNVSLFPGVNRITAWGDDLAGNHGNASTDWINAPYSSTAPNKPELWPLPSAMMSGSDFGIVGFLDEILYDFINVTVNFVKGDNFYTNYTTTDLIYPQIEESLLSAEATVSQNKSAGSDFFYITDFDYDRIGSSNFTTFWVEFSSHNRTYWFRYNVTNTTDNPGEDARIYIDPPLEDDITGNVTLAGFYDSKFKNGWFNVSIENSNLIANNLTDGTVEIYAVPFRNVTEGFKSDSLFVYMDSEVPRFNLWDVPNVSFTREPFIRFDIRDDFQLDIRSLLVRIYNSTFSALYTKNSKNFPDLNISGNIPCFKLRPKDGSRFRCRFTAEPIENGTYTIEFNISDIAGWKRTFSRSFDIIVTVVDILSVFDEDDITNNLWLYFNWTATAGEVDQYEFALGTELYPTEGYNSVKDFTVSNTTGIPFNATKNDINTDFGNAYAVAVGDLDGDGDLDVVGGGIFPDKVVWWNNTGSGEFTEHVINDSFPDSFADPRSFAVGDLDGDGDLDVVGAASGAGDVVWWANNGSGDFTQHAINLTFGGAWSVAVGDLDGDGDLDVVGTATDLAVNDVVWWENNGSVTDDFGWPQHVINDSFINSRDVAVGDLDGDGDLDIVGAAFGGNYVVWWENKGGVTPSFTQRTINNSFGAANHVAVGDFNSDGHLDIVGTAFDANDTVWWENTGPGNFIQHMINDSFDGAESVVVGDLDGDGDLDVVGAGRVIGHFVWWENDGSGTFTQFVIDNILNGPRDVVVGDLDGDGDLDVVGANVAGDDVVWYSLTFPRFTSNTEVNFTHETNLSDITDTELKMMSGTVYYLTVRALNLAGEYGEYASSDGILFIDPTPPIFMNMTDYGPWTNSNSQLSAAWNFEDNESDIIEYLYTIGTAQYPTSGYNSVTGPTLITSNSVTRDNLGLEENLTYYFSVKARNGNVAINYSGSWSAWESSGGIQVDTTPPDGGSITWQNASYATSGTL